MLQFSREVLKLKLSICANILCRSGSSSDSFLKAFKCSFIVFKSRMNICTSSTMASASANLNFIQKYNPSTNKFEWTEEREDYDFHQEIARAAYADMLHDHDRNQKYEEALSIAINKTHALGHKAVVLDIGTGTGLLSMMAVRHGADAVYACEAFRPMADCAAKVIRRNGFTDKIKLIPKRSTELEVGPEKDLETRANILVTEVFDTELIGEGAIETFNHAHQNLLTDDAIVIPDSAEIYAMVVQCSTVNDWNTLNDHQIQDGKTVAFPPSISDCSGVPSVHDLQLSRLDRSLFTQLSPLIKVFTFSYSGPYKPNPEYRSSLLNFECLSSGTANTVFTWWVLNMDQEKKVIITMQPEWWKASDIPASPTWKDHWMQCVYYLPERLLLRAGHKYCIEAFHDEFSLWYYVKDSQVNEWIDKEVFNVERPVCTCGVHICYSRARLGMMNDQTRFSKYVEVLKKVITASSVCLSISEGSILPLLAARLGARKVFVVEEQDHSARVLQQFIRYNNLTNIVFVVNKSPHKVTAQDLQNEQINVVLGEPYFSTSVLPWHNLYFWHAKEALKWSFSDGADVIPRRGIIKAIPVVFSDFHNIKAPVGVVKSYQAENPGYDIQDFDELVLNAADMTDQQIDSQPLWEYASYSVGKEFEVASIDLSGTSLAVSHPVICNETFSEPPNAMVFWMDWILDSDIVIDDSPTEVVCDTGTKPSLTWNYNTKQGVYLIRSKKMATRENFLIQYDANQGNVKVQLRST